MNAQTLKQNAWEILVNDTHLNFHLFNIVAIDITNSMGWKSIDFRIERYQIQCSIWWGEKLK